MICEKCSSDHDGSYGSGRFCSEKCSRGFSTIKLRNHINYRVSKKFSERRVNNSKCKRCGTEYFKSRRDNRSLFCSKECKKEYNVIPKNCCYCGSFYETKRESSLYCSVSCSGSSKRGKKYSRSTENSGGSRINIERSEEYKRIRSASNKGGKVKWIDFIKCNGEFVKLQGSYEYRFAKILDKIDPDWIKPTIHNREHQFRWEDSLGIIHWYTPDFWSPKFNRYFETKGYWSKDQMEKKSFIENIKSLSILYIKDIELIENEETFFLNYV